VSARSRGARAAVALAIAAGGAFSFSCHRAPAPAAPDGAARLGEQRRWTLAFEARMTGGGPGGAPPLSTSITGDWSETIVARRPEGYDVACALANPRATGAGVDGVQPEEIAALERRMAHQFFVSYRADGAAMQIHFPRDVDPGARNLLQIIVTDTQIVRPAQPATQWTALERDGAGTYLAAYHRANADQIVKTKLKYVAGAPGAPAGVDMLVDASERHLTVDAHDALLAFDGGDTVRIALPTGGPGFSMRVATRLSDLRRADAPELVGALERERGALVSTGIITHALSPEDAQARRDGELTAGAKLPDLIASAATSSSDDGPGERLEAWLRLHADAIGPTCAAIRRATPGAATKALTAALGRAGTPAAQAALVGLAGEVTLAAAARADALVALMLVTRPTTETLRGVAALVDAGDPVVSKAARFAAGTLARTSRATAPAEAAALDVAIGARFDAAKDAAARADLLGAIGNSAGPALLPRVRAALGDADLEVRAAGARALRLYEDDAARDLLAATITADREPIVRAAAIFSAGFGFDARYVEPLTKAALSDATDFVRKDAVALLGAHRDAAGAIDETLAHVAKTDAKAAVRLAARTALERAAR
jgi:hypothetical protein